MKSRSFILIGILMVIPLVSCKHNEKDSDMNIIFLHHSTGGVIWEGGSKSKISEAAGRISSRLGNLISPKPLLPELFLEYNRMHDKKYLIKDLIFPKTKPYGWDNYPFDYYNIWVKNAGEIPFMDEPTLELLTKQYQVVIFKHCFPTSNIQPDQNQADINSDLKTISNYKLQYTALREKLHQFPATKFILFTGAAQVKSCITENQAIRAKEFFRWVTEEWDLPDDNIYLWDFYKLQTEGDLYFKAEYAVSANDSHPNDYFAGKAVHLLFDRIIDVIDNDGKVTQLTGEPRI